MREKRKEKPVLQVLLVVSLTINTTLTFVVLAKRNSAAAATERKDQVARPAVVKLDGATVDSKAPTATVPPLQPKPLVSKKALAPDGPAKRNSPAKTETPSRPREEISFFSTPEIYRLKRDTILTTRRDGAKILIPQGTLVRVAGFSRDDKALVVSRRGNPDGLIPSSSLEPALHATP